jgi:hypothetical protein
MLASVQRLFSCLLPKNVKIKIKRHIIPRVTLHSYGTQSLTISEKHRLGAFRTGLL